MEKNPTHYLRIHCFLCWTANTQRQILCEKHCMFIDGLVLPLIQLKSEAEQAGLQGGIEHKLGNPAWPQKLHLQQGKHKYLLPPSHTDPGG